MLDPKDVQIVTEEMDAYCPGEVADAWARIKTALSGPFGDMRKDVEVYVDDYIDMGHFANPEVARPYLIDGMMHGISFMRKYFTKVEGADGCQR